MKQLHISTVRGKMFAPLMNSKAMQAAMMTLRPGQVSGELGNEHPKAEQWLFVVSGSGMALGKKSRVVIRTGSLLFVRKGEVHQIRNTGRKKLVTLNFYAPPAYTRDGNVRVDVQRS